MRADLLNRIERVKAVLERRQSMGVTLVYADGSKRSMGTLEAVDEICRRDDVVDVLSEDDTVPCCWPCSGRGISPTWRSWRGSSSKFPNVCEFDWSESR